MTQPTTDLAGVLAYFSAPNVPLSSPAPTTGAGVERIVRQIPTNKLIARGASFKNSAKRTITSSSVILRAGGGSTFRMDARLRGHDGEGLGEKRVEQTDKTPQKSSDLLSGRTGRSVPAVPYIAQKNPTNKLIARRDAFQKFHETNYCLSSVIPRAGGGSTSCLDARLRGHDREGVRGKGTKQTDMTPQKCLGFRVHRAHGEAFRIRSSGKDSLTRFSILGLISPTLTQKGFH